MSELATSSSADDEIQIIKEDNDPARSPSVAQTDLESARLTKDSITPDEKEGSYQEGENEADKLEAGGFQPHAYPHIAWPEGLSEARKVSTAEPAPRRDSSSSISRQVVYRTFGRGGAGRRQSSSNGASQITSEAAELARAEAASWAQMTPLMAATLGPLSCLLGIPTLTQRWHGIVLNPPLNPNGTSNFQELPDPALNLVLAGIALFCEVTGNALLILRFSNYHTKVTTWLSYIFWIMKIIFGVANYIEFGIVHPETTDIIYLQGFWVGVCGLGVTAIIVVFLTFNLAFLHRQSEEQLRRLHHVQREFMFQTVIFFFFLGIAALIFSEVEQQSYVNGIYFMVVTTLTIGFGDLTPTTAVIKVLVFPFTIIGITLLALIVTSIVRLLADRARRRKIELKRRLKKKENAAERKRVYAGYGSKLKPWAPVGHGYTDSMPKLKRTLTLQEELQRLREDDWKRERRSNLRSMLTGFTVFLIFWFIGALIFHFVEPWGYGNSLYFCYIFFLTIGYGDFYPTTEAGRPIFIVYALCAVPTMTIIVETVTTNFTAFTMQRVHARRQRVYLEKDFQIQSLSSLVRHAKESTCQLLDNDNSDAKSIHLPLHALTERLTESLHQMHHHLQTLLMQKLGPEGRNVIAAERARQSSSFKVDSSHTTPKEGKDIALHLSDIGTNAGDELELLNEYRQRYAKILAELAVAKETLVEYEKGLEVTAQNDTLRRRLSEELEELSGDEEIGGHGGKGKGAHRRSMYSSDGYESDEEASPDKETQKGKW